MGMQVREQGNTGIAPGACAPTRSGPRLRAVLRAAFLLLLWLVAGLPEGLTLCLCWCPATCAMQSAAERTAPRGPCCEAEAPECCGSDCSLELDNHPDPLALPPSLPDLEFVPPPVEIPSHFSVRPARQHRAPFAASARPPPFRQRSPELRI